VRIWLGRRKRAGAEGRSISHLRDGMSVGLGIVMRLQLHRLLVVFIMS
jgi:hypothetical protein